MAKRKSKLTPTQQAYRRERQRIQRQINRMTNRGYDVPELLPKIPKKITEASVRRLKKITTEKLYKESRFIDFETGEILTSKEGQALERSRRKKSKQKVQAPPPTPVAPPDYVMFDKQILTVFTMEMTEIFGRNDKLFNYITRWYNMSLEKYGAEEMAEALEEAKSEGLFPGWEAVSDSEILVGKLETITNLMAINSESREELFEELEQLEDWTEGD
jgi:hypothetical protein|nr:MAG TPA: hypothetical protein [Caudoviricetes sp.]